TDGTREPRNEAVPAAAIVPNGRRASSRRALSMPGTGMDASSPVQRLAARQRRRGEPREDAQRRRLRPDLTLELIVDRDVRPVPVLEEEAGLVAGARERALRVVVRVRVPGRVAVERVELEEPVERDGVVARRPVEVGAERRHRVLGDKLGPRAVALLLRDLAE